jgi:hypothetical protein
LFGKADESDVAFEGEGEDIGVDLMIAGRESWWGTVQGTFVSEMWSREHEGRPDEGGKDNRARRGTCELDSLQVHPVSSNGRFVKSVPFEEVEDNDEDGYSRRKALISFSSATSGALSSNRLTS